MSGFDDLDDFDAIAPKVNNAADIRKNAHVVNGGEATFPCPSCGGTGMWRGRGRCFKCDGKGKVIKGVVAAAKGKVTRENNFKTWCNEHAELLEGLRRHSWNDFLAKLLNQVEGERRALSERQVEVALQNIDKWDARRAEKEAAKKVEQDEKSGVVDISAIEKLFATATDNAIKRPIFRADKLVISKAPMHGNNAGALYVTNHEDVYLGKIIHGKFEARREATVDTLSELQAIAADPLAESVKYARRTGNCGCCGRGLVNPVSILANIGPICASKWGLDWRRDLAETEYAEMKAEEAEKGKKVKKKL